MRVRVRVASRDSGLEDVASSLEHKPLRWLEALLLREAHARREGDGGRRTRRTRLAPRRRQVQPHPPRRRWRERSGRAVGAGAAAGAELGWGRTLPLGDARGGVEVVGLARLWVAHLLPPRRQLLRLAADWCTADRNTAGSCGAVWHTAGLRSGIGAEVRGSGGVWRRARHQQTARAAEARRAHDERSEERPRPHRGAGEIEKGQGNHCCGQHRCNLSLNPPPRTHGGS